MQQFYAIYSEQKRLEELDWPLLKSRRKKEEGQTINIMLYKFRNGLLNINSKHAPTSKNQKKCHCLTHGSLEPNKDHIRTCKDQY